MSAPAQVIQAAYADLVSRVFLCIRNRVFKDEDQLHELGDALHNVSAILGSYGAWIDDQEYRALYLRPYDSRWATKGLALESYLNERIEFHSKKTGQPVSHSERP